MKKRQRKKFGKVTYQKPKMVEAINIRGGDTIWVGDRLMVVGSTAQNRDGKKCLILIDPDGGENHFLVVGYYDKVKLQIPYHAWQDVKGK